MGRGRRTPSAAAPSLPALDLLRLFPEGRPLGDSWEQEEYRGPHCHYLALALERRFGMGLGLTESQPRVVALIAAGGELWGVDVSGRRRLSGPVDEIERAELLARAAELGLPDPELDYALHDASELLERYLDSP